jgi:HK97 family phage prohead protease
MSFLGFTYDPDTMSRPMESGQHKEHIATKAAVTETAERGQFSAIAAAWSLDRQNERIIKGAFKSTIEKWQRSGKDLPVHWDHRGGAEYIIGSSDASSLEERVDGLYVEGTLDIKDSELAREAWRSVKKNRIGLSFGFLVTDERKGDDGVRELLGIDLFEITLTGSPVNPDARVLSAKSATDSDSPDCDAMTTEELRAYSMAAIDGINTKSRRKVTIHSFPC